MSTKKKKPLNVEITVTARTLSNFIDEVVHYFRGLVSTDPLVTSIRNCLIKQRESLIHQLNISKEILDDFDHQELELNARLADNRMVDYDQTKTNKITINECEFLSGDFDFQLLQVTRGLNERNKKEPNNSVEREDVELELLYKELDKNRMIEREVLICLQHQINNLNQRVLGRSEFKSKLTKTFKFARSGQDKALDTIKDRIYVEMDEGREKTSEQDDENVPTDSQFSSQTQSPITG